MNLKKIIIPVLLITALTLGGCNPNEETPNTDNNQTSGDVIIYTGDVNEEIKQQEIVLITDKEGYSVRDLSYFPKVKFNTSVEDLKLVAEISFTDSFVNVYNYENSTGYFFGLKFFVGTFDNGGFYGVIRKQNGGIGNSQKHGLVGAKLATEINSGAIREIALNSDVPVAVNPAKRAPTYQVKYLDMANYINTHLGAELPIGVYLSSTKEKKGWEITKVKSLKLVYVGRESDVEVIK